MGGKQRRKKYQKINVDDVEEAREDERLAQKYRKQSTVDNALFAIDTVGGSKGLAKSVRLALKSEKRPRGFKSMTKESLKQVDKMVEKISKPQSAVQPTRANVYDLWNAPNEAKVKKPAKIGEKTCKAPAVIVADPGQAVNPASTDQEELLFKAAAVNIAEENAQMDLNRRIKPMTAKLVDALGIEEVRKMTDSERLAKYQELMRPAGDDIPVESALVGKKERKTTHQKNKRERHLLKLKQESIAKKRKLFHKSIAQVPSMLRELKTEEQNRVARKEYTDTMKRVAAEQEAKGNVERPKRIGRLRFKEAALDIPQGKNATLRSVVPTIVVAERINSIYRRNLIEQRSENTRFTLRRMKHQARKKVKNKKLASSLQRSLLLS